MKFKVKTYFGESENKTSKVTYVLLYFFNLLYRSIIPMMLFYTIIKWDNAPTFLIILMWIALGFFTLYQFTWGEAK